MTKNVSYEEWLELKEYRDYLIREVHSDWSEVQSERICLALEEYPEYEERYYNEER